MFVLLAYRVGFVPTRITVSVLSYLYSPSNPAIPGHTIRSAYPAFPAYLSHLTCNKVDNNGFITAVDCCVAKVAVVALQPSNNRQPIMTI